MSTEGLKNIKIEDYTYELPEERIAKHPLSDRSASKLLLYEQGNIVEKRFADVPSLLRPDDILIFNNTRVIYARLFFQKPTGARIEVFCLEPLQPADYAQNFASRHSCDWICMVGNLKKWKDGTLECLYEWEGKQDVLTAERIGQQEGEVHIRFSWDSGLSFSEILEICGRIPIPPYLNRDAREEDKERYQTIYSKEEGSVAAPTAGLHFTPEILSELTVSGVSVKELTLHVGAGTFRPVKAEVIGEHDMHTEHLMVSRELIAALRDKSGQVVAVGTTSVRTLESLYWMGVKLLEGKKDFDELSQWEVYDLPQHYALAESMQALAEWFEKSGEASLKSRTTIIILPGYRFRVIDALFTNFHQPQSTLLLLVAAAIGEDWRKVYRYAFEHDFRFLSYGDSSYLNVVH